MNGAIKYTTLSNKPLKRTTRTMTRVPTWTELRLDATKLANIQKECYRTVHELLDSALPELDKKINSLVQENCYAELHQTLSREKHTKPKSHQELNYVAEEPWKPNREHRLQDSGPYLIPKSPHDEPELDSYQDSPVIPHLQADTYQQPPPHSCLQTHSKPYRQPQLMPPQQLPRSQSSQHAVPQSTRQTQSRPLQPPRSHSQQNLTKQCQPKPSRIDVDLEHLEPLPMPICEYLRRNRPDFVMRADQRTMYLRKKAERRKDIASIRIINSLQRIRLSNRDTTTNSRPKSTHKTYVAPEYQVKYKLSEHEMKRLTAKIYKRLPEVKRRRREEVTNYTKVQNYKNRLEYGRKLLENRRQGIINYPLRSMSDDFSVTSSQEDFPMNGFAGAEDASTSDPYY